MQAGISNHIRTVQGLVGWSEAENMDSPSHQSATISNIDLEHYPDGRVLCAGPTLWAIWRFNASYGSQGRVFRASKGGLWSTGRAAVLLPMPDLSNVTSAAKQPPTMRLWGPAPAAWHP